MAKHVRMQSFSFVYSILTRYSEKLSVSRASKIDKLSRFKDPCAPKLLENSLSDTGKELSQTFVSESCRLVRK